MKKIVTLLLALSLVLCLCACGEDTPTTAAPISPTQKPTTAPTTGPTSTEPQQTVTTQPAPTEPKEPTEADIADMWEFAHIYATLKNYMDYGFISHTVYDANENPVETYSGQEALQYCYDKLAAMGNIDRWMGTEYTNGINWRDQEPVWDRLGALSGFSMVSDVKLRQDYKLTKKDSSEEVGTESAWEYDAEGKLLAIDGIAHVYELIQTVPVFPGNFTVYFQYSADGTWSQIDYGSNQYAIAIPVYNGNRLERMDITGREGPWTVNYSYSGNLLTKIEWEEYGYPFSIEYEYDGSGNVVKSIYTEHTGTDNLGNNVHIHYRVITEYTYNGNQLVSATSTEENWSWDWDTNGDYIFFSELETVHTYSYGYNSQGQLASVDITYGDSYWVHGDKAGTLCRQAEYASKHIDIIYGNYFFYEG